MEIKKAIGELGKPEKYLPTVAGGIAGVIGGVWAVGELNKLTAPYEPSGWAATLGVTGAAIVGMMAVKPGEPGQKNMLNQALHTAFLTAAVTGGIVAAVKLGLLGSGIVVGRVGPSPGLARTGGIRVVGKPMATPTYAQAQPVTMATGALDVIPAY